jgi:ribonuclease D
MVESLVTAQEDFAGVCDAIREAGIVAMDTEFVSEGYYRPELCLLQLALPGREIIVDPLAVEDLSDWWRIMADDEVTVVAHAARQEVRFCLDNASSRPLRLWDVQIAEGLRTRSYPLNHERLVARVLGKKVAGTQSRTDWRRRPLSDRQVEYARDDVRFLLAIHQRQSQSLESLGRQGWAEAEFERMIDEVEAERGEESWRRLSGVNRLDRTGLAVARAVYRWRDRCGEELDQPVRRVLRDDLLIDLAKRKPKTAQEVLATRDMTRRNFKCHAEALAATVREVLAGSEQDYPERTRRRGEIHDDDHVLGQLLAIALANRCAELDVAVSLVGTSDELKTLVRWHVHGDREGGPPRLCTGWRAEVCGDLLTDVLDGKISLRVTPEGDTPLVFERGDGGE